MKSTKSGVIKTARQQPSHHIAFGRAANSGFRRRPLEKDGVEFRRQRLLCDLEVGIEPPRLAERYRLNDSDVGSFRTNIVWRRRVFGNRGPSNREELKI